MSLEDQYDAWVRSVTGTGRHSATKQDRDAAQNSLNAMQAQLDALAESQKRQKSAADALNAVQRAGAATADSVRRMSSELTQSLRQDGLLGERFFGREQYCDKGTTTAGMGGSCQTCP